MLKHKGFTLIEVMIVVGIIAILAAIAFPMYGEYVTRGKIQEATSQLSDLRVKMEQFYQDSRRYGKAAKDDTCAVTMPAPPMVKYFEYECKAADANAAGAQSYQLVATGKDTQGMKNFVLTIDQSNTKTTESVGAGWTAPNPKTCWVQKKGGDC